MDDSELFEDSIEEVDASFEALEIENNDLFLRELYSQGRFDTTSRQRCSRLVRKTLSFSKSLDNHIGAIKYFITIITSYEKHYTCRTSVFSFS